MFIGMVAGALLGGTFAWIASSGHDEAHEDENPIAALGPSDYFQLAIGILSLARQFGAMLKRSEG
jgi:hypothetical protein